jgi:hypothetical protein
MPNVTSPQTVSFGNPAALIAPDVAAQQIQLARQQQLIDLLKQRALTPDEQQTVTGAGPARVVPYSPFQGAAKMLTAYLAGKNQKDVDSKNLDLSRQYAQRMAQILNGGGGVDPSVAATASLGQGAAQQPPQQAPDGSLVNTGGVGPTVQNAQRMDAMSQGQPAQSGGPAGPAGNNFGLANLLRGSVIEQMGGSPAAAAYWDTQKLPDAVKTNNYYGLSQGEVSDAMRRTNAAAGQTLVRNASTLGRTNQDGSFTPIFTAPDTKDNANITWQNGKPVAEPIQGLTAGVQSITKARTLGEGEGLPYAGVDASGNPLPVTNRTAVVTQGQPTATQPVAPQAAPSSASPMAARPADSDRAAIYASEIAKNQDMLANPAKYMSPADLAQDPDMSQFKARAQSNLNGLQREVAANKIQLPAQAAPNGGAVYAAPPLGQTPYSDKLGADAAARATATRALASDSPTRVNVYDNILNLSRQGVNTGPGAEWQAKVKGYVANAPFLSSVTPDKWKDDVSGFQELNKFLYQNAQRNWQAAGGTGTDSQLEAFSHSSPNDKMFPQALQAMAQWGKGGELAVQGKARAQDSWLAQNGDNPKQQQAFENAWRSNFEPQLFQLRAMDPQAQQSFIDNLKKTNPSGYNALINKAQTLKSMGAL